MTRGRKPLLNPTRPLKLRLDAKLLETIESLLYSDAEQRVPKGGYQAFFTEAAIRILRHRGLDLAPFAGSMPTEHVVFGSEPAIKVLQHLLRGEDDTRVD